MGENQREEGLLWGDKGDDWGDKGMGALRRMFLPYPHQEAPGDPMPGPAHQGNATIGTPRRNYPLEQ